MSHLDGPDPPYDDKRLNGFPDQLDPPGPRCRTCGQSCFWQGIKDHVGRQTSEVVLVHHLEPADGHAAVPRFARVEP